MSKMNELKRMLSILLCAVMMFSYIPVPAHAMEEVTGLCEHHAEHTAECGYEEGVSDCAYHCHICHVQELIDALPAEVTAENEEAVKAQLTAIDSEKASLSDEELSQVDFTNYTAAAEALGSVNAAIPAEYSGNEVIIQQEASFKGYVTADRSLAVTGEIVTLTVTAAEGYELEALTVEGERGTVSVTEVEAGKTYTFVMPNDVVDVTATFKAKETTCTCTSKCVDIGNPDCAVCSADRSACEFTDDVEPAPVDPDTPVVPDTPTQSSYNVTIGETANGTVTVDKSTAAEGETVTLTVNPDVGYELDTLKIPNNAEGDVGYVPVNKVDDTNYTFTMPATHVTVTVTFKEKETTHTHTFDETTGVCTVEGCGVAAAAKIGDTYYTTLSDAAAEVTEGGTIEILTDVTIGEDETVTFAAYATLAVAEGKTITCNGTVQIGTEIDSVVNFKDGIIFQNQLYYDGGDKTSQQLALSSDTFPTYYKAGEGYAIYNGSGTLTLNNATITDPDTTTSTETRAITTGDLDLTICFYGTNTLRSGATSSSSWGIYSRGALTLQGMGDAPVLHITSSEANQSYGIECGNLTIASGTVDVISVDGTSQSTAVMVSETLTVNGTLNTSFGAAPLAMSIFTPGEVVVGENGTVNALALEVDIENAKLTYSTVGAVVISADTAATVMEGLTTTFTVSTGTTLTVNSGVTLDLSGLAIDNIQFLGTVVNNGTIKLPAGFDLDNAPKSGTVVIGEDSYTWNGAKWICGETTHTGGTATCTEKAVCDICGTAYGELEKDNHTGTVSYAVNAEDESKHDATWTCCGTTTEVHDFTTGTCVCGTACPHSFSLGSDGCTLCGITGGYCGATDNEQNVIWTLVDSKLTITGTGATAEYGGGSLAPWDIYAEDIQTVVIEDGVTNIGAHAFEGCTGLTSITIPDSVTTINTYAFGKCTSLTSVTIPAGVTALRGDAFYECTALTAIYVDGDSAVYKSEDGVVFTKDGKTLVKYPQGKTATEYTIPNGVEIIGYAAFQGCANLETVSIPDGVTYIDFAAFNGCAGLKEIVIPATVEEIGGHAFVCPALTEITFLSAETDVYDDSFRKCDNVAKVNVPCNWTSTVFDASLLNYFHVSDTYTNGFLDCCGEYEPAVLNADGYYEIANAGNLFWFAQKVNGGENSINAVLTANIDMKTLPWEAMGQQDAPYTGTFDGRGYTISNLSRDTGLDEGTRASFVYYLGEGGCIKNVTFDCADVFTQGHANANASAVVALRNSGTIECVVVTNSRVQLGNYAYLAGIAGVNESTGVIKNCAVLNTTLTRRFSGGSLASGGIVYRNLGTVEGCYTYGCSYSTANESNGGILVEGNAPVNSYYYTTSTVAATDYAKTPEQFASGEVTWLLNGSTTENAVWKQTVGLHDLPSFSGATVNFSGGSYNNTGNFIYVEISWTEMSFTYSNGEWNPDTHAYDEPCWRPDTEGGGTVTVTNKGSAVYVSLGYTSSIEGVDGSFDPSIVCLENGESHTASLNLTGEPTGGSFTNQQIGSVTVTISQTPPAAMTATWKAGDTVEYIGKNGKAYSCYIVSDSDGKYVLLTKEPEIFNTSSSSTASSELDALRKTQLEEVGAARYPTYRYDDNAEFLTYESYLYEVLPKTPDGYGGYYSPMVNGDGHDRWAYKYGSSGTIYWGYNTQGAKQGYFYYIFEVPVS